MRRQEGLSCGDCRSIFVLLLGALLVGRTLLPDVTDTAAVDHQHLGGADDGTLQRAGACFTLSAERRRGLQELVNSSQLSRLLPVSALALPSLQMLDLASLATRDELVEACSSSRVEHDMGDALFCECERKSDCPQTAAAGHGSCRLAERACYLASTTSSTAAPIPDDGRVPCEEIRATRRLRQAVPRSSLRCRLVPLSEFVHRITAPHPSAENTALDYVKWADVQETGMLGSVRDPAFFGTVQRAVLGDIPRHVPDLNRLLAEASGDEQRLRTDWALWVGAEGSSTALHKDSYFVNYMYVVAGRKRVVLVAPSAGDSDTYGAGHNCSWFHGTCWPRVDVLTEPPSEATVVEVGAGEGFHIPYLYWHAVENLQPTVAVSFVAEFAEEEEEGACSYVHA